jgi:hypothetical protein
VQVGDRRRIVEVMQVGSEWTQTAPHEWALVDKMGRTLAGLIKKDGPGTGEAGEYYIKTQAEDRLVKSASLEEAQETAAALVDVEMY